MLSILGFAALLGASQAMLLGSAVILRRRPSRHQLILAGMLILLGIWQCQTAFSLLALPDWIVAGASILHFPAMLGFAPLFYAYIVLLFFPGQKSQWPINASLLMSCMGLIICLWRLFITTHDDSNWIHIVIATWSRIDVRSADRWLWYLSLLPRPLAVLAGGLATVRILSASISAPRRVKLRHLTLLLLFPGMVGTMLSVYAQLSYDLRSVAHGWGALLITLSVIGLYLLDQRYNAFTRPVAYTDSDANRSLTQREYVREALRRAMQQDRVYRLEDLTINSLAALLSDEGGRITARQLSEFINSEHGQNFNQYINALRVREACEMLRGRPDRSILQIALEVGFNSKSTFHAAFKTCMHMSPGEYRKAPVSGN